MDRVRYPEFSNGPLERRQTESAHSSHLMAMSDLIVMHKLIRGLRKGIFNINLPIFPI